MSETQIHEISHNLHKGRKERHLFLVVVINYSENINKIVSRRWKSENAERELME